MICMNGIKKKKNANLDIRKRQPNPISMKVFVEITYMEGNAEILVILTMPIIISKNTTKGVR